MNNRYAYIPSGLNYKVYDKQAKTDNEYIVSYNINNIEYLYNHLTIIEEWIENLPDISDLSGYYTKEQTDLLLELKLNNYQINNDINQEAMFGYTETNISPYIKKIDLTTNNYTELRILTTGAHLIQNDTTYIAKSADEIVVKELLDNNINLINNQILEINDNFNNYYTNSQIDLFNQDFNERITKNEVDILTNKTSINTLNSIISANFETFGRYNINGKSLNDNDGEVRFNISEQIPLNEQYIKVELEPNKFTNLKSGKITFNIIADGIINNETNNLTIELKIYKNDNILDNESKVIEAGTTSSVNFAGTFPIGENDICYASLEIINGVGTLSTNNNVVIAIDFKSDNIQQAIKSSQLILDYDTLPNNGANPKFVQIDNNTINIESNLDKININIQDIINIKNDVNDNTDNIDKINTSNLLANNSSGYDIGNEIILTKSYKNYKYLNIRMGINDLRVIKTLSTRRINVGDKIILEIYGSIITYLLFQTETTIIFNRNFSATDINKLFVIEGVDEQ